MRINALSALVAALSLNVCGCMLPLGVAYPTVSSTPAVPIGDVSLNEIRAFRVDFVELRRSNSNDPTEWDHCIFEEINLNARKAIPSQTSVGFSYWVKLYPIPGDGRQYRGSERSYDKWVHVRLYRPGYHTIEISPASDEKALVWNPARTDEEREEALDQLIGIERNSIRHLEPGSRSANQHEFLRFAAAEYERLAQTISEQSLDQIGLRTRMLDKASRLRGLAMN